MAAQTCTGDCLKCSFQQQTYCSAQRTYGLMKNQEAIVAILEALEARLINFISPSNITPLEEHAQSDPGAENRGSENNN